MLVPKVVETGAGARTVVVTERPVGAEEGEGGGLAEENINTTVDGKVVGQTEAGANIIVVTEKPKLFGNAQPAAEPSAEEQTRAAIRDTDVDGPSGNSESSLKTLQPTTVEGVEVISGGIGNDEADEMKALAKNYSLRLTFATKGTGSYIPDVDVLIRAKSDSGPQLEVVSPGPLFYAKLPPGSYKVEVSGYGKQQSRDVTIGARGGADVGFYW